MNFKIRDYQEKDFEAFSDFTEAIQRYLVSIDGWKTTAVGPHYKEILSRDYLETVRNQSGIIKIVEANGKIVGTGLAYVTVPSELIKNKYIGDHQRIGMIKNVFIDEDYRGSGIGTTLINELEEHLRLQGCKSIRLTVFEPNKNAHALYTKLGYEDYSRVLIKND